MTKTRNRHGGGWPNRTPNSTPTRTPRGAQRRYSDGSGEQGCPRQYTRRKIWQGWQDVTKPTCIRRGVQVETTDRQAKQIWPRVHWWHTWQKTERGTPYQQGLDPIQCFHVVFCICYHSAGGGDQQILPPILGHTWRWTFSTIWHYWIWNVSVSSDYYSNGTWHMG
jgi:hypothetical protein